MHNRRRRLLDCRVAEAIFNCYNICPATTLNQILNTQIVIIVQFKNFYGNSLIRSTPTAYLYGQVLCFYYVFGGGRAPETVWIIYFICVPPSSPTGLTWSQCDDSFMLHALPTTHCTNYMEAAFTMDAGIYHTEMAALDYNSAGMDGDVGAEDMDYAMDCGDFIF